MADILMIAGAALLILLGLFVAYRGLKMLTGFVRTAGALIMGFTLMIVGGIVGLLMFGPLMALVGAVAGGILGLILGAILAPSLLWLMLTIIVFILCFNLGMNASDSLGATDILMWTAAILAGLIGSWAFSFLARRVLAGATSLVGGLLVGTGAFMIVGEFFTFTISVAVGIFALLFVFFTGYGANRKKKKNKKKKKD